jgi:spore maturation protein CgeB
MGIPTLSMSLDDKAKFHGALEPTGYPGMADIAGAFTLCWTSAEDALEKYRSVGAKAIYLPAGANPDIFRPYDLPRDIDVSFIGQRYGWRPVMVDELRRRGIHIKTFGKGWERGEIPQEDLIRLYSRSKITLGFAGVADSKDVFCLKGRDFEAPMSGAFYLTQYHPEIEHWFEIGKEIVCFRDIDDLVKKIRHYLAHPEQAEEIRRRGRRKCLKTHTWVGRFNRIFGELGILK